MTKLFPCLISSILLMPSCKSTNSASREKAVDNPKNEFWVNMGETFNATETFGIDISYPVDGSFRGLVPSLIAHWSYSGSFGSICKSEVGVGNESVPAAAKYVGNGKITLHIDLPTSIAASAPANKSGAWANYLNKCRRPFHELIVSLGKVGPDGENTGDLISITISTDKNNILEKNNVKEPINDVYSVKFEPLSGYGSSKLAAVLLPEKELNAGKKFKVFFAED